MHRGDVAEDLRDFVHFLDCSFHDFSTMAVSSAKALAAVSGRSLSKMCISESALMA